MAKEEGSKGLLSKMVRFVRNPATSWSELDKVDSVRADELSKQLKEMIERKRQDDFVRKREFDMLRKLRKREPMAGQDQTGTPSFFQSSFPFKQENRASTIKKIDEIEAQMSMQWWKGSAAPRTNPQDLPTEMAAVTEKAVLPPPSPATSTPPSPSNSREPQESVSFTHSKFAAYDVEEAMHDPELEEASIRYANGDDAGAEAGLREAIGPNGSRAAHAETWLTLFDLFRATGQQVKFEEAAVEFVNRLDRSAPQWFSLPSLVNSKNAAGKPKPASGKAQAADWVCPSVLGVQSVAALKVALGKAASPWRLDWTHLKTIEAGATAALHKTFSEWASQPVQLSFIGEGQLASVLQAAAPSSVRETAQDWWLLRLEFLRLTQQADPFEMTALDFCITYEVSPPSWVRPASTYRRLDKPAEDGWSQSVLPKAPNSGLLGSESELGASQLVSVELAGKIEGDPVEMLNRLEASMAAADVMVISCANLIRVDFSAASTLLNWVAARSAEGRLVQFTEVNRLVASFFKVIGITDHARVQSRID
ncbi:MAG: STAS domain-containing protein [Pseudomonadota bacterium]